MTVLLVIQSAFNIDWFWLRLLMLKQFWEVQDTLSLLGDNM